MTQTQCCETWVATVGHGQADRAAKPMLIPQTLLVEHASLDRECSTLPGGPLHS